MIHVVIIELHLHVKYEELSGYRLITNRLLDSGSLTGGSNGCSSDHNIVYLLH